MIFSQENSEIIFTISTGNELARIISQAGKKFFLLTDSNTINACYPEIKNSLGENIPIFTINAGEENKNIQTVVEVWDFLNKKGANRKSVLINLGGGVLCDLGGFAASTFKRGLDFINIPTTLLSQVDASVGGKTGINFKSYKNEIGTFSFPLKVIIDTGFLKTLTKEHLLSGYAEMIKHAFISDESYYHELQKIDFKSNDIDYSCLLELVKHSVKIKEKVVLTDPVESGLRKILNFGHTVGHAFESYFMGTPDEISHGRAVIYGMAVELYLSCKKAGFPENKLLEALNYLNNTYGKLDFKKTDYEKLVNLMTHDKKNDSANINFTLIKDFGKPMFDMFAKKEEIIEAFDYYMKSV